MCTLQTLEDTEGAMPPLQGEDDAGGPDLRDAEYDSGVDQRHLGAADNAYMDDDDFDMADDLGLDNSSEED